MRVVAKSLVAHRAYELARRDTSVALRFEFGKDASSVDTSKTFEMAEVFALGSF